MLFRIRSDKEQRPSRLLVTSLELLDVSTWRQMISASSFAEFDWRVVSLMSYSFVIKI